MNDTVKAILGLIVIAGAIFCYVSLGLTTVGPLLGFLGAFIVVEAVHL